MSDNEERIKELEREVRIINFDKRLEEIKDRLIVQDYEDLGEFKTLDLEKKDEYIDLTVEHTSFDAEEGVKP